MNEKSYHEPPTLPPPPVWRLVIAAAVVLAFLVFMYHTYEDEPAEPRTSGSIERMV